MITRTLGQTGIRVSVVGFGGMRFFNRDEAEAKATVRRCVEKGITFFETGSYGGGRSEEVLGKALWEVTRRDQVVLADKAAVADFPTAAAVRAAMEASLRRYQTDYFDVFNFWGTNTPEMHEHILRAGLLDEVLRAKEEGLVRAIGLTTHARPEWIRDFVEVYPWDCVVLKEHLLYSRNQEVIAHLADAAGRRRRGASRRGHPRDADAGRDDPGGARPALPGRQSRRQQRHQRHDHPG